MIKVVGKGEDMSGQPSSLGSRRWGGEKKEKSDVCSTYVNKYRKVFNSC